MEALAPSAQTTLLILLGASTWPLFPEFQSTEAFANAARGLKAYFLDLQKFGLPAENLLDLFDSNHSPDELDIEIGQFLERRIAAMKTTGNAARDVLLFFVGHGGFVGRDSDFYLAIRRTRADNPRASGLQAIALADTLTEKARHLRRIIILDCCFAAAAFSAFQAGPAQVAIEKTVDAFEVRPKAVGVPTKGTTLFCSSNHKSPSLLLPNGSSTMFTKAFLDALIRGAPSPRDHLTLRDVKDVATDLLSEIRNAPKPVVHSPDQSEGDIADIPFFPNPKIEEERRRRAEEERTRKAEGERVRKAQEVEVLGERYQLQDPIIRGEMATIYRGQDLRMARIVAIKVLHEVYSTDPKFVTRFQREAKAASALQHPNIVQVYDYGQADGNHFIVMELVDGSDLCRFLHSRGILSIKKAIIIAHDIALGLGAVHRRGIVHCDVKPQNVLLGRDGSVKLTNFGIANIYRDVNAERLTTTGMTVGTVQYDAPEQARGEIVSPATDVYALGIVMYEMLTGRTPFDSDTPVKVAMQHVQDLPTPPSHLNHNILPTLEGIIMHCLEKVPEMRYRDGSVLARALEEMS